MKAVDSWRQKISEKRNVWLITGAAGFIGGHLLEELLRCNQRVIGIDNFSTGRVENLEEIRSTVTSEQWNQFKLIRGDIRDFDLCSAAVKDVDYVLHQAALGSVPRSIDDPITTNSVNIGGFLNIFDAARRSGVRRIIYAASSSTYGDSPTLPKIEEKIGRPLSPYAVTKYVNELYAEVYSRVYNFNSIGLRYFNVFGPRQDPNGAYAAVIPKWIQSAIDNQPIFINGDGSTTRDFCYVDNVVQANILAAMTENIESINQVYNVAVGHKTSLLDLYMAIRKLVNENGLRRDPDVIFREFRAGDVAHSLADISKAIRLLGYSPTVAVHDGLKKTISWWLGK